MDLTTAELRELATFFAKRMSPELEPLDPTDPPPAGDPGGAWLTKLEAAQQAGALPDLARRIAAADRRARGGRSDATLQQACELLGGGGGGFESLALGAVIATGAAVTLVAAVGASMFAFVGLATEPEVAVAPSEEVTEEVTEEVALQPQSVEAPELQPQSVAPPELQPQSVEQAEVAAAVDEERPDRCTKAGGGVVGYWYAGAEPPGQAGEVFVLPSAVNVRADYPDRHNRYDARAPVRCVLEAGDRVRLSADPIAVPPDRYWVPLVSGDLLSASTG